MLPTHKSPFLNRPGVGMRVSSKRNMLIVIAVVCCLFLLYQFLSLGSIEQRDKLVLLQQLNEMKSKLKPANALSSRHEDSPHKQPRRRPIDVINNQINHHPGQDTFKCLVSGENIPISAINDDYCDCEDGTDEPKTNACPDNKFNCVTQSHHVKSIPASRVNDGICDCCDGSDEFGKNNSPDGLFKLQLHSMRFSQVKIAPCRNVCDLS